MGLAIWRASHDDYADSVLADGSWTGAAASPYEGSQPEWRMRLCPVSAWGLHAHVVARAEDRPGGELCGWPLRAA
ncbi:hypothetical protein I6A60_32890 [Frankia sp. AgB1.9]|uniref:hypothetical protein n=1 Tax=unclassified Frankia TaxID=2632575 RepID=UPI001933C93E|nr:MULTISPECIES: hypothetical protein [unclassified Frankia]MBL7489775.1 hypothetical protein [Frankia sp. AgW1.1]MBL7552622.1 hypothetical protein [Frankia sp. AgB1.9]MBL7623710.1 hypothetical protein [Frankia sp. AgB1.8]